MQEGSDGRCLRLTMPGREEEVGLWRILPGFLRSTHLDKGGRGVNQSAVLSLKIILGAALNPVLLLILREIGT